METVISKPQEQTNNTKPLFLFTRSIHATMDQPSGSGSIWHTWDPLANIGLVTIDIKNLLAPYGGDKPYQDEMTLHLADRLGARGVRGCLLSNASDGERVSVIADELGLPILHKGVEVNGRILRSKTHPEIYEAAIELVGFGDNGSQAAHFDDQMKNYRGMRKVPEFTRYFWTYPRGILNSHKGVLAVRPFETVAGHILALAHSDDNR